MPDETWRARIDWDADDDFGDTYDDVSADLVSVEIGGGRSKATDQFAAGTCTLVLENAEGRYSRYNSASPIYGQMLPGREVIVDAAHSAVTYPRFRGTLVDVSEGVGLEGIPTVTLQFVDPFERLRLGSVSLALQENKRVDEIITAILDAIGWAAGRRTLDTAVATLPAYAVHNAAPLTALQEVAKQEIGGQFYAGDDGNIVFESRDYRSLQPVYATITDMAGLTLGFRQGDLIDSVRAEYARLDVDTALSAVFALSPAKRLAPGTSTFDFTLNASDVVGAKGYITPLVATTDYVANTQRDGSGVDKTAQVTLTVTASDAGGGTIQAVNADSSDVWLTTCQVRAYALWRGGETNVATATASAPIVTGQLLSESFAWNDDEDDVSGWAGWQAEVLSQDQPRPVVELEGHTDAEIAMLLGLGISARVEVSNLTGLYPSQLNGSFFVEAYRFTKVISENLRATVTLFSEDQAAGSAFIISDDTPGGSGEYSEIVSDAATAGDRISW